MLMFDPNTSGKLLSFILLNQTAIFTGNPQTSRRNPPFASPGGGSAPRGLPKTCPTRSLLRQAQTKTNPPMPGKGARPSAPGLRKLKPNGRLLLCFFLGGWGCFFMFFCCFFALFVLLCLFFGVLCLLSMFSVYSLVFCKMFEGF